MNKIIDCFLPFASAEQVKATVEGLKESALVDKIFLLATDANAKAEDGCELIHIDALNSSATMKKIAEAAQAPYILLYTKYNNLVMGYFALDRFVRTGQQSRNALCRLLHRCRRQEGQLTGD